jgi:nitrite reductase (cytochrome c-552)
MMSKRAWLGIAVAASMLLSAGWVINATAQTPKPPAKPPAQAPATAPAMVSTGDCFGCHAEVGTLWDGSPHVDIGCATCHAEMEEHLADSSRPPVTSLELSTCGECHADQYQSFYRVNWDAPARLDKGSPAGRSPLQDKLLAPHGFTVEHNEPRSHPFMVVDQLTIDRFAGGRYVFGDLYGVTRPAKTWEVVVDTGTTIPGLASAGNPVCLQCKTSDLILTWKHMGDPDPRAKWDRTSDVNALIRDVHNPMGCIHCHDPHATRPRIVRDALLEGIAREGANPYAEDKGKDQIEVISFRDFRRIGMLRDNSSNLLCGQCHVEYSCNPGFEPESGEKVTMADRRANHFPMRNVLDLLEHFDELKFRDFRHEVTGARLVKLQHPEMETYWGSVHERAGVKCANCHMLKETNAAGQQYTSHQQVRPRHHVEQSCLPCHPDSSVEEKVYQIDTVRNYTRGKQRKAEYHLSVLIDTYAMAVRAGVAEEVLAQARRQHEIAHVLWEWWTAENSDGWHNPELARESLLRSQTESRQGTELLRQAMAEKAKPEKPKRR